MRTSIAAESAFFVLFFCVGGGGGGGVGLRGYESQAPSAISSLCTKSVIYVSLL
jgi:hypothetical protein